MNENQDSDRFLRNPLPSTVERKKQQHPTQTTHATHVQPAKSKGALLNYQTSSYHGQFCQCLSCKLDHLKASHPTTNDLLSHTSLSGWIPQEYRSLLLGTLIGSVLTLCGVAVTKQWRSSVAFAHLFSKSPTVIHVSETPIVLVNNATENVCHVMTSDPSLGILYCRYTAYYQVTLNLNLVLRSPSSGGSRVRRIYVSIVKNGLPNDDPSILRSQQITLEADILQSVPFGFKTLLRSDDYLQVFVDTDFAEEQSQQQQQQGPKQQSAPFSIVRESYDWGLQLLKVQ